MGQVVSITSQGQISIPAALRRRLGLDKYRKAYVKEEAGKIVVEPVEDIFSLHGSLASYVQEEKVDQEAEEGAFRENAVKRYREATKK